LIKLHVWSTGIGMLMYFGGLTWAGIQQGRLMNNPELPFLEIVAYTVPWLASRSVAGVLMTVGHLAFAVLVWRMLRGSGSEWSGPTLFTSARTLRSQRAANRAAATAKGGAE
jgi:cytochrome c oxidase cbb3-type subunit 1